MARRKYVVGNWKMNGTTATLAEARAILPPVGEHPVSTSRYARRSR